MILHDLSAGMHPRRVRIFMAETGIAIDRCEVDAAGGANAIPDFLRLNPCLVYTSDPADALSGLLTVLAGTILYTDAS